MTAGLHHVALTVTDIEKSIAWYQDLFGFVELIREEHHGGNGGYGVVLGPEDWSMFVVLNQHPTNAGESFDPVRTGLDHVGFTVPDKAGIDEWVAKLEEKGVTFSPVTEHGWGWSLNFRDPDDVQLQLIAFAAA
jgi:catechol 2,3-dioxygenase-like lactoylglutathione lyase family enzyme